MKLTHLALFLTLGLLCVTGYLAWDSRMDARGSRNQLELYQRQQKAAQARPQPAPMPAPQEINVPAQSDIVAKENQLLGQQTAKTTISPPPLPPAARPHVNMDTSNLPPPMTPRQRQVLGMPAIARVKQYSLENGFVVIDAGKSKKLDKGQVFALRRSNAIVARIKIGEVEDTEAIGDVDQKSVPIGVIIEVGDEVIQDLPPEI